MFSCFTLLEEIDSLNNLLPKNIDSESRRSTMLEFLKHYLIAFVAFLVIDLVWLVFVAKDLYQRELGFIMSDKPN